MRKTLRIAAVAAVAAGFLAACSSGSSGNSASTTPAGQESGRAIVLVSGTASVTPFTTSKEACVGAGSLSAGSTYGFIRDGLVAQGFQVYTAPVSLGGVQVPATADEADGPFSGCPAQLPADVTINSIDSPQLGGERLAAFVNYLNKQYGITQVDLVGHSLGGIFVRNGVRVLKEQNSPVTVRTLTTLSSPWEPVFPANPMDDHEAACDGSQTCLAFVNAVLKVPSAMVIVKALNSAEFDPWTQAQAGVLENIPVTLIGGSYFTKPLGNPDKWPNDGIVQLSASLARNVPDSVIPIRSCFIEPTTHSAFISKELHDDPHTGVTWNDTSVNTIANAVRVAGTPQQLANRLGCPTPTVK